MSADRISGVVLAGGRSSRFGRDKLAERIGDTTLLDRAVGALAGLCTDLVIVVGADAPEPGLAPTRATRRVIHDPVPDGGPLVGLAAGLEAAPNPVVLVVAGDMPALVPDVLRLLAEEIAAGAAAAALEEGGRLRPLPAAFDRARAIGAVRHVLTAGGTSLGAALTALETVAIPEPTWRAIDPDGGSVIDIDRPEDLVAFQR